MATKKPPKKPRSRPARPKQLFMPGTEPPRIPEVDQAADAYYEAMNERLPYTQAEKECKETLINKMVEHQLVRYETADGLVVNMTDSKNVAVKPKKDAPSENGQAED